MNNKVFLKKVLLVFILVCMTFIATACDFAYPSNVDGPSYTPSPSPSNPQTPPKPKDTFPAIPVHKQTKALPEEELLGSDFFSSKKDYLNIGLNNRYVDLKKQKKIYIRYEQNLEDKVKRELDNVVAYLHDVLMKVDPSYELIFDVGTPGFFDLFTYDTVYIKNPDNKVLKDFKDYGAAGATYFSSGKSPVVYINKDITDVIIDGKNIRLARILLHEIMHGFGFGHTLGTTDALAALQIPFGTSSGRYFYY